MASAQGLPAYEEIKVHDQEENAFSESVKKCGEKESELQSYEELGMEGGKNENGKCEEAETDEKVVKEKGFELGSSVQDKENADNKKGAEYMQKIEKNDRCASHPLKENKEEKEKENKHAICDVKGEKEKKEKKDKGESGDEKKKEKKEKKDKGESGDEKKKEKKDKGESADLKKKEKKEKEKKKDSKYSVEKLKQKLEKIESKMQKLLLKKEDCLKLLKEAEVENLHEGKPVHLGEPTNFNEKGLEKLGDKITSLNISDTKIEAVAVSMEGCHEKMPIESITCSKVDETPVIAAEK